MNTVVLRTDPATHRVVQRCPGPSPDGACPFVGIGDVVPCAGDTLVLTRAPEAPPYTVPSQMTLCPCTVAAALAVPADWDLLTA